MNWSPFPIVQWAKTQQNCWWNERGAEFQSRGDDLGRKQHLPAIHCQHQCQPARHCRERYPQLKSASKTLQCIKKWYYNLQWTPPTHSLRPTLDQFWETQGLIARSNMDTTQRSAGMKIIETNKGNLEAWLFSNTSSTASHACREKLRPATSSLFPQQQFFPEKVGPLLRWIGLK